MDILKAERQDLKDILELQKKAFYPVSLFYNNPNLGPLHTTEEEINNLFDEYIYLKATIGNEIVGSLRAKYIKNGNCRIENVIVDPNLQRKGIGAKLVNTIENEFGRAEKYELLTGENTPGNVNFYQKLGYHIVERIPRTTTIPELVRMQKSNK